MVNSINFVVLGDYSIAAELGKKGTTSDIAIYDRKTQDTIYSWTVPITFPDKIQSLMQAVNMAEYAILNVTKLDKYLGEQMIALDSVEFKDGFILHSYDIDETKLKTLMANTSLSNFKFLDDLDQLKQALTNLQSKSSTGTLIINVDHAFDVKGVGTVILGVIKQGRVNIYDELTLLPTGKSILVKSIQMHDDSVHGSESPARVGLAIKGATADEISRGDMICSPDTINVSSGTLSVKFTKSSFFKADLAENQTYMLSIGLQIKPAKIKQTGDSLEITPEKPMAYRPGEICVLLKPDSQGTRIVGKGIIQ
ncbi:MAG TPA: EF-Tu/IF-2/RF-3 family GTPase [Nitrososphaerales archaeon]|nr:EF-Tu/IF-2/RF-3 family GTPase [Nitrososphaerales archaeon]